MLNLVILTYFLSSIIIAYLVLSILFTKRMEIDDRINYIENLDEVLLNNENLSFHERVLQPFFNSIGKSLLFFTPENNSRRRKELYEQAGFLRNTTYERFLAKRVITSFSTIILVVLILFLFKVPLVATVFVIIWVQMFVLIIYRFKTKLSITSRSNSMVKDLPYTLDLITVSVEAGLSLDGAIGRIITNIPGALSEEFGKTLKEMRMGIDKKIALKNLSIRCGVRDITILVNALIQADELGVSLGKVLRIEGAQLREKRKQLAKEKAMKAPVKMLFPTLIFIFPSVFIIILGPAVIKIFETFR